MPRRPTSPSPPRPPTNAGTDLGAHAPVHPHPHPRHAPSPPPPHPTHPPAATSSALSRMAPAATTPAGLTPSRRASQGWRAWVRASMPEGEGEGPAVVGSDGVGSAMAARRWGIAGARVEKKKQWTASPLLVLCLCSLPGRERRVRSAPPPPFFLLSLPQNNAMSTALRAAQKAQAQSLYRRSLKHVLSWAVNRELFWTEVRERRRGAASGNRPGRRRRGGGGAPPGARSPLTHALSFFTSLPRPRRSGPSLRPTRM